MTESDRYILLDCVSAYVEPRIASTLLADIVRSVEDPDVRLLARALRDKILEAVRENRGSKLLRNNR